jgi:hypothetical protein
MTPTGPLPYCLPPLPSPQITITTRTHLCGVLPRGRQPVSLLHLTHCLPLTLTLILPLTPHAPRPTPLPVCAGDPGALRARPRCGVRHVQDGQEEGVDYLL